MSGLLGATPESLKTTDRKKAIARSGQKLAYYQNLFETNGASASDAPSPSFTYTDLKSHSKEKLGFDYRTREEIKKASFTEKLQAFGERFDAMAWLGKNPSNIDLSAMAGEAKPGMSLDRMFERYKEICVGQWENLPLNEQKTKWARYSRPKDDFKKVIGDIDILDITTSQTADYAIHLQKRVVATKAGTAKKGEKLALSSAKDIIKFLKSMASDVFQRDFPKHVKPTLAKFETAMRNIYHEAKAAGYTASGYWTMLQEQGAMNTARRLVLAPQPSPGFGELLLLNRLDLTVESLIVREPWRSLFEPEVLVAAQKRLDSMRRK
ncbi:hypothetical protein GGQ64_002941 [Rhizobium azooxidifex]|uniref:Uncharacterized protein n=2 Tax=Mycoplana azooxidifex TaxID=1636188 RepID=A0A7W6DBQ9_9HYPH|nr:hypothetical protein [Mycoplana azooxidifex]